jgi:hypothetical protein
MDQRQRIERNKAIALERRRLFGHDKTSPIRASKKLPHPSSHISKTIVTSPFACIHSVTHINVVDIAGKRSALLNTMMHQNILKNSWKKILLLMTKEIP